MFSDNMSIEADTQDELKAEINRLEKEGWTTIREWVDQGIYCALLEEEL